MIFANWYDDACSTFGWMIIIFVICVGVLGQKMKSYTAQNPEVGKAATGGIIRLIGRFIK